MRKCPYCDFNSYRAEGAMQEEAYVAALLRDLDAEPGAAVGRPVHTVFIGGGTPSLFSGAAIARLLQGIRARIELTHDVEITLEANPGAADAARFAAYRDAGVNRLSIGVQSFRDAQLAALGRAHDAREAEQAVASAWEAGFSNVNIDLMYALPDDSPGGALADLARAVALEPAHVSWYQLTLEPSTAFHRRPPKLPGEDVVLEIERMGRDLLARSGYERYEVSAYARPGMRCRHNLHYWQFGDYVGIGAGAHGKLTLLDGAIERRARTRNPRTYIERAGTEAAIRIERVGAPSDVVLEFLMNALRLPNGVTIEHFEHRTGQALDTVAAPLSEAMERGWISRDGEVLKATPAGLSVLNEVLALFVSA